MSQIVLTKYFVLHFMSAMKTHMEIFFQLVLEINLFHIFSNYNPRQTAA